MTQLQRDQLLFKNYLGQFCNSHAQALVREISEFDHNGEHNEPEEESIGDENEPMF